jgi:hypothetical protein
MAIGEGLLTGTTPVIWNWDGAKEIWGDEWLASNLQEAKNAVSSFIPREDLRSSIISKSELEATSHRWEKIISES